MTEKIVFLGASSQVGFHLLPLLEEAGCSTLAVSRHGTPPWWRHNSRIRWTGPGQLPAACVNADILVSAGPLPVAAELCSRISGLKQIIALSSASVQFKRNSSDHSEQQVMTSLLQAEQRLERLSASRAISLTIFRPTMIYGSGMDENLCRLARWIRRFGLMPVAGQGSGLRQPLFAGDLARLVLETIMTPAGHQGIFPVAGASQLSYREILIAVFSALGKNPRLVELPVPVYAQLLRMYSMFRPGAGVSAAMAARQNCDLLVDTDQMLEKFSFRPGEFRLREEYLLPP